MPYKILIVDDEPGIVSMLKDYFEFHGYLVYTALNGKEALKAVNANPDIILLDINMPDINGFLVCKRIREYVSCPIIFLTARIEESDTIRGFQSGADDYVVKPFKVNELGARVNAHLRRQNRIPQNMTTKFYDQLAIDYGSKEIKYEAQLIPFTKKEFDIIELLSLSPNQVFDKERIYEQVWGYDGEGESSVIVEHIRRIRNKFLQYTKQSYIETIWGCGYKWKG
jgi:two-component system, OmpR family, lantibiotic biosynthesis response regulator NisR/SpaR